MNSYNLMYYAFLNTAIFQLTQQMNLLTDFQSLKREMRFTRFNSKFINQFPGQVLESAFKQYGSKQTLFIHVLIQKKVIEFSGSFKVYKCKEYYIDCVNVVSYDIINMCSKLDTLTYYNNGLFNSNSTLKKCPVFGEYYYKNISIDTSILMPSFTYPSEKWWERYWRVKVSLYNETEIEVFNNILEFYFI